MIETSGVIEKEQGSATSTKKGWLVLTWGKRIWKVCSAVHMNSSVCVRDRGLSNPPPCCWRVWVRWICKLRQPPVQTEESSLPYLDNWTGVHFLTCLFFVKSKCEIMHIARSKPMTKFYELCGQFLSTVDSSKYLGVIISNNLDWHEQVCSVAKKANSVLQLISQNLHKDHN